MPDENTEGAPPAESDPSAPLAGDAQPAAGELTTAGGDPYTVDDASSGASPPRARRGALPIAGALLAVALVSAALAGVLVWLFSGGGEDKTRLNADVTNVLNAFSQGQNSGVSTRYEGQLPPGLPSGVPVYPGAKIVSSVSQVRGADVGYLVIYDTRDARDKVASFYKDKLDADNWQIESGQDGAEATVSQFSKTDDPNVSGLVLVAQSKEDKLTTIVESVQVTTGAKDTTSDAFKLDAARSLPDGYPDAVPPYADAVLIESAYQKASGNTAYAVSYITKAANSDVLDFYRGKLQEASLTVTDADASGSTLEGAQGIQFSDSSQSTSGQIIVGKFDRDKNYTRIDVQVRVSKSATGP